MKIKQQQGFTVVEGLLILVIVGIIGATGWYVISANNKTNETLSNSGLGTTHKAENDKSDKATNTNISNTPSPQKAATPAPAPAQVASQSGTIKGKPSYSSEGFPADERVCAETVANRVNVACVNVGGQQVSVYELKVPAGSYYVYSETPSNWPGYKAYWNEFAKCGLSVNCPASGHKQLLAVSVQSGQTVSGIDPGDWYDY